jgi:hypothetical protein
MQKEKNMLTQRQVDKLLLEQKEKGYPSFKKRIVRILESEYSVSNSDAVNYVFHPEISERINMDIEWAQHMGARYWADLIFENFLEFPKRHIS